MTEVDSRKSPRGSTLSRVLFYLGTWFLLFNVFSLLLMAVIALVQGGPDGGGEALRELMDDESGSTILLMFVGGAPITLLWTWFFRRHIDRRSFGSLGFADFRWVARLGWGWWVGLLLAGLPLALGVLTGVYRVGVSETAMPPLMLGLFLLGFLVQGSMEEIVLRGYAQRNLVEWLRRPSALPWILAIPSFVFACAHLLNPSYGVLSFVNTFLLGAALGAFVLSQGSLWGAMGLHAGWNFGLACVWSMPVSGLPLEGLLDVRISPDAAPWTDGIFGGEYGPEGGLVSTVIAVVMLIVLLPAVQRRWVLDKWGTDSAVRPGGDARDAGEPPPLPGD